MKKKAAIILARGGSKRIPGKNIKIFFDRPLIAHSIISLQESEEFSDIFVSTDAEGIKKVSESYGAKVPFMRSKNLSTDTSSTDETLLDAIDRLESQFGNIDVACCAYPNPFLTPQNLKKGLRLLCKPDTDTVFPVVEYEAPIQHAFNVVKNCPKPVDPKMLDIRSQSLTKHYHDAGMFYLFFVKKFKKSGKLFTEKNKVFILNRSQAHDINDLDDWKQAETKFQILLNEK